MKPRNLIVTDDALLGRLIALLTNHGAYERRVVADLADARGVAASWRPHVIILDIDTESGRGLGLVAGWKQGAERLPVIGVTRQGTIEARLGAFERGIDDLLVIPFAPEELVARMLGAMRRVHGADVPFVPEITVGHLRIDLLHQVVRADGQELALTPIERALVYILVANAGETVSRDRLLDYVWGYDREIGSNIIDRHVVGLRQKMGDDPRAPRFIETVAGAGYRFLMKDRSPQAS